MAVDSCGGESAIYTCGSDQLKLALALRVHCTYTSALGEKKRLKEVWSKILPVQVPEPVALPSSPWPKAYSVRRAWNLLQTLCEPLQRRTRQLQPLQRGTC